MPNALLPESGGEIYFLLHEALHPVLLDDANGEEALQPEFMQQGYARFRISVPAGTRHMAIRYQGSLGDVENGDGGSQSLQTVRNFPVIRSGIRSLIVSWFASS